MTQARRGAEPDAAPLAPTTQLGRLAVASLALVILVVLTSASVAVAVPAGLVMAGLAAWSMWRLHDPGLLLVLPLVTGVWTLVIPLLFGD